MSHTSSGRRPRDLVHDANRALLVQFQLFDDLDLGPQRLSLGLELLDLFDVDEEIVSLTPALLLDLAEVRTLAGEEIPLGTYDDARQSKHDQQNDVALFGAQ